MKENHLAVSHIKIRNDNIGRVNRHPYENGMLDSPFTLSDKEGPDAENYELFSEKSIQRTKNHINKFSTQKKKTDDKYRNE